MTLIINSDTKRGITTTAISKAAWEGCVSLLSALYPKVPAKIYSAEIEKYVEEREHALQTYPESVKSGIESRSDNSDGDLLEVLLDSRKTMSTLIDNFKKLSPSARLDDATTVKEELVHLKGELKAMHNLLKKLIFGVVTDLSGELSRILLQIRKSAEDQETADKALKMCLLNSITAPGLKPIVELMLNHSFKFQNPKLSDEGMASTVKKFFELPVKEIHQLHKDYVDWIAFFNERYQNVSSVNLLKKHEGNVSASWVKHHFGICMDPNQYHIADSAFQRVLDNKKLYMPQCLTALKIWVEENPQNDEAMVARSQHPDVVVF